MEIRFNTINKEVEEVLETIDKHNRKFFVETAILHYIKYLQSTEGAIDLFYDSRNAKELNSDSNSINQKVKPNKDKSQKVNSKESKSNISQQLSDNTDLAVNGW